MLFKQEIRGNSLTFQWLGFSIFTAMAWVQSQLGELRSRKLSEATKKTQNQNQTNKETPQNKEKN